MATPQINTYYRQARFLISAAAEPQFPKNDGLEIAFSGRSNAGKSSAINALCDNKSLSQTSKTPGRTRLINFFTLDDKRYLVDLPGYGYAKVPLPMKQEWQHLMEQYLQRTSYLRGLVIIMDIRRPLSEFDSQMLGWCQHFAIPAHILLSKADKLKRGPQQAAVLSIQKQLKADGYDASVQAFSATSRLGLESLVLKLNDWLSL